MNGYINSSNKSKLQIVIKLFSRCFVESASDMKKHFDKYKEYKNRIQKSKSR